WSALPRAQSLGAFTIEQATSELSLALGLGALSVRAAGDEFPRSLRGACVPLVGDRTAFQVALIAEREGLVQLARAFLQLDGCESVREHDVTDAICELVNMPAGRVKVQLARHHPSLRIGPPVFIDGEIRSQGGTAVVLDARIGAIAVTLVLLWKASS